MTTSGSSGAEGLDSHLAEQSSVDSGQRRRGFHPPSPWAAHALALLFVAAAWAVRVLLDMTLGQDAPYLPFIVAVLGAAWLGGLWPGLVATIVGGSISTTIFMDPAYVIPFSSVAKVPWLLAFLAIGGLISGLNQLLHISLKQAEDRLEQIGRAEAQAQANAARLNLAIDSAPFPIMLLAEDSQILSLNRAWTELTGYTRDQLPRLSDWIEKAAIAHEQAQAAAILASATSQARTDHGEILAVTSQGAKLVWDVSSASLGRLPDGRQLAIIMAKDVTGRKHAEQELLRLNNAVEAAANGIAIVDRHGVFLWVNPAFAKMTGYSKEEVVGLHTRILKSDIHDQKFYRELWSTVVSRQVWRGVLCNRRKDGTLYHEEMTITPIMDDASSVAYFIAIKEDITDKQHLLTQLQQSQKMEAVGQLAGGVAHDFNNLLTIISGYSEMLLSKLPADDPQHELLKAIHDAGGRAAGLTRQLLAFSRRSVLEPKVLDLNALVHETEKMLRRMLGEDILLTTTLDPQIKAVKVDPGQLGQVLLNLAVNARDAMPRGGKLTIETSMVELDAAYASGHEGVKQGQHVLLAVSDTGEGMTQETKARIFEPFFTTKGEGKGTGLGLAVVHGIVRQSGGAIQVYSEVGVGTTFKIYLPAVLEEIEGEAAVEPAARYKGSETICLVEDEVAVMGLSRYAFQSHGYKVMTASSGKEALSVIDQHGSAVDLLVTDVVMPGMSGRQLADALSSKHPKIKVLFTSGYTDDAVVRHGILQADVAFLQKPFTPMTLLRKARQVLDQA